MLAARKVRKSNRANRKGAEDLGACTDLGGVVDVSAQTHEGCGRAIGSLCTTMSGASAIIFAT
jgi:hypothetical protein